MSKANYKTIESLNDFVKVIGEITKDIPKGYFVFRGQGSHGDSVQSGAFRRLANTYEEKYVKENKLIEYHEKIIEEAKKRCESHLIIKGECDMIVLGEIQHYGGATNLIDFTFNSLVALYFACNSAGDRKSNGKSKVYCLNTVSTLRFLEINSENKDDFEKFVNELEKKSILSKPNKYYKWKPPFNNNRIIKQDGVFIFNGEGYIDDNEFDCVCIINKGYKTKILTELEKGYYISEESLFPDFVGYVEANSWFKPLEKIDVDYYFRKALDYQQIGELDSAIKYYKQIIEISPNDFESWFNMGIACFDKGENDEVIKCYKKALEIKPDDHSSWYSMGCAYSSKGENDEAIKCYKKALEIKPDDHSAWFGMGYAYSSKGENDEAIKCYKKALEIKPDDHSAWHNMGILYSSKGEKEKADECFKKAKELKK